MTRPRLTPAPRKRRGLPLHRIKTGYTYDVAEAATLLGVHRNTVRQWLKAGLEPLDQSRPILIHGTRLKAFLTQRRDTRRATCGPGEFYCFRCKAPRKPWAGMVDSIDHGPNIVRLIALCEVCETTMHKTAARPLEEDAPQPAPERISDHRQAS